MIPESAVVARRGVGLHANELTIHNSDECRLSPSISAHLILGICLNAHNLKARRFSDGQHVRDFGTANRVWIINNVGRRRDDTLLQRR